MISALSAQLSLLSGAEISAGIVWPQGRGTMAFVSAAAHGAA